MRLLRLLLSSAVQHYIVHTDPTVRDLAPSYATNRLRLGDLYLRAVIQILNNAIIRAGTLPDTQSAICLHLTGLRGGRRRRCFAAGISTGVRLAVIGLVRIQYHILHADPAIRDPSPHHRAESFLFQYLDLAAVRQIPQCCISGAGAAAHAQASIRLDRTGLGLLLIRFGLILLGFVLLGLILLRLVLLGLVLLGLVLFGLVLFGLVLLGLGRFVRFRSGRILPSLNHRIIICIL